MKNKRWLSLGLAAVLIVSVCGCSKNTEPAEETVKETEPADAIEVAERVVSRSAGGDAEKEEIVYVNADAGGNVKSIIVSSWLKNSNGSAELTDVTKLKNIVNVKGDEIFTQDENTYTWAADGNDIYYQGETSEALPVDVKVSYYLDDKELAPEELAGKSGKVKIRFDYENHSTQKVTIGGEETELCVPFLAASTVILDSDKFVNVEVENGRILSDGKNTIVAGVAMPGLYDSLDLGNLEGFEDIDIPEYVEVTADVTDFELAMTATILMPDVFGELDTEDMDGFDDLKDDIEELNDATYDLIDGCVELDDGVQELKDNMPDLWDGAVELDDGAQELDDGAKELDDGAQDLMDGADKLNDGAKDIREGAKELDQGVGTLQSGVGLLNDKMPQLTGGVDKLASGLQSLQDPMMLGPDGKSGDAEHPYIKTSVGQLKNGVDTLVAGVSGMGTGLEQAIVENQQKMQAAEANVGVIKGNLEQAVQEAGVLQAQLTELAEQMGMVPTENHTRKEETTDKTSDPAEKGPAGETADAESSLSEEESSSEQEKVSEEISSSPEVDSTDRREDDASAQTEDSAAVSENSKDQEPEQTEAAEADISKENEEEDPAAGSETAIEKSITVPEETVEDESAASSKTLMEEDSSTTSEEPGPESTEEPETTDTELSEFAKVYLEGLRKSEGMNYVSMVPMADQGKETAITDSEAVIAGYQKVVALQTYLIKKLNEITTLQNELREAATDYAGLVGADTALRQIAGQFSASSDASQLAQLTEGMAALEASIGQIYDGVALINSQMGTLTTGAAELKQGVGSLKEGAGVLKGGTKELYQGGIDLREGTKELYEGTQDLKEGTEKLKDGTVELKDGTQELKDGVVDLVDGVDELKDGTEELLDGVHEYNDDGIQKLYDTVNVDLQNLLDRVDAIADLSEAYQSFSGKSDAMKGSVKFIVETEAIEVDED